MKRKAVAPITVLSITLLLIASIPSLKADSETPQPQWSQTYSRMVINSGDEGRFVIQTTDGGYAIFGVLVDNYHTNDNITSVVIKTDSLGNLQWEKTYPTITFPTSIFQTNDSGFLLCGSGYLLKTNGEGNVQWSQNFSNLFVGIQASDGGYILAGTTTVSIDDTAMLLKTNENGSLLWNKTFSSPSGRSEIKALSKTVDGGYAFAGYRDGAWFAIVDSDGNLKVNKVYSELDGYFNSIVNTEDGRFILAGGTWVGGVDGQGLGLLAKTDFQGSMQWYQNYNNPPWDSYYQWRSLRSVAQTGDGGYIAVSASATIKTDASGRVQWEAIDFDPGFGAVESVTATKDGGFVVVGASNLHDGIYLAKFAPESNAPPDNSSPVNTTPDTPSPVNTPDTSSPVNTSPLFPTSWILAAFIIVLVALSTGLLIYFKKRKR